MRKIIRLLISFATLVMIIGAIFFAGKPEISHAQNDGFKLYQLLVFCGDSSLASAIFGHEATAGGTVGRPLMGTKTICVGNCGGGRVSLEQAVSGLPAEVSADLYAKVDKHQADAAEGKGLLLTCVGTKPECRENPDPTNGKNCCINMPEKGSLFAWGTTVPVALTYSEASTDSRVVGNQPNGTRVVYTQTTRINGQKWYYVHPPGRPAGWMRGSELSCTRPGDPVWRPSHPYVLPDGSTPRPTAAHGGARG